MKVMDLYGELGLDDKKFDEGLGAAKQKGEAFGDQLGSKLQKAAAVVAATAGLAFKSWHDGFQAVRTESGLTGDALDEVMGSFKNVAGDVNTSLGETGQVLGFVYQKTKLVGPELEALTKKVIDLTDVTNSDVGVTQTIIKLLQSWQVETADQAATLDLLLRAYQATGTGIDQIATSSLQARPFLQQLGFSIEDSIALAARLGATFPQVLAGLKIALANLSKDKTVTDIPLAFAHMVRGIENAGSVMQSNRRAIELFGSRAGPGLAAAIREGRLAVEDFLVELGKSHETTESAEQDIDTLSRRIARLKNEWVAKAGGALEPAAWIAGVVVGVEPAVKGINALRISLKAMTAEAIAAKIALTSLAVGIPIAGYVLLKDQVDKTAGAIMGLNRSLHTSGMGGGGVSPEGAARADAQAQALERVQESAKGLHLTYEQLQDVFNRLNNSLVEQDGKWVENKHHIDINSASQSELNQAIHSSVNHLREYGYALTWSGDKAEEAGSKVTGTGRKIEETQHKVRIFAHMTRNAFDDWRRGTVDSLGTVDAKLDELADKANITAKRILSSLQNQIDDQRDYEKNWKVVLERAGGHSDEFIRHLQEMGMDGASIVAALAKANKGRFDDIVDAWQASGRSAKRISRLIEDYLDGIKRGADGAKSGVHGLRDELASLFAEAAQYKELPFPTTRAVPDPRGGNGGSGSGSGGGGGKSSSTTGVDKDPLRVSGKLVLENGEAYIEGYLDSDDSRQSDLGSGSGS